MSSSKKLPYFFNTETKQSSWDPPGELSQDEIDQLPGAKEYLRHEKSDHDGQVRASHLLIKHSGSRRPSSWKEVGNIFDHAKVINLNCNICRKISLARKKKPLKSCDAIKQRLMGPPTHLRNWLRYIPIVPPMNMVVTLVGSDMVRCRNRLRMLLMDWRLEKSVM